MKGGIEARTKRIAAWDFAAAACALMALGVMTISAALYALLPIILGSAVMRQRLPGGGVIEIALSLGAVTAGTLLAAEAGVRNATGILAPIAAEVLLGGLFLVIARLYLRKPRGGNLLTLSIGLAAMTAGGAANLGWAYLSLSMLYLLTGLHGLRALEHARTQPRFPPLRQLIPGVLYLAASAGFTVGLLMTLPQLYGFATERFVDWIRLDPPKTGFTEGGMFLGAMEGMWESDEIVLRIDGNAFNMHLRGSVHRRYRRGTWLEETARRLPVGSDAGFARETQFTVQRLDSESAILMAPLGSVVVTEAAQALQRDVFQITRSITPDLTRYQLAAAPAGHYPLGPEDKDLEVPEDLHAPIHRLAKEWTSGTNGSAETMAALVRSLEQEFVYSQHYQRTPGRDPLLEFLQNNRQGHCEYFASALTLLARTQHIPARVVRGYRVRERNPLTGQHIVRESNAHAWVEAWINGRWRTYDPAPMQSLEPPPRESMSWTGAAVDALQLVISRAWEAARAHLSRAGYLIASLLAAAFVIHRALSHLRARRRRVRKGGPGATERHMRPQDIEELFAEMAAAGLRRLPAESLEHFAERTAGEHAGAREIILSYASARYGTQLVGTERS